MTGCPMTSLRKSEGALREAVVIELIIIEGSARDTVHDAN